MEKQNIKKNRVRLLDEMRGICILVVVVFHALYDILYIYNLDIPIPRLKLIMDIIQPPAAGSFVFISGIVSRYSRSNLKRGFIVFILGTAISTITMLVAPESIVRFGVLSLLGSCMIIFGIFEKFTPRLINISGENKIPFIIATISFMLYLLCYSVPSGYVGIFGNVIFKLPESFYSLSYLYPMGFPYAGFYSTDYFPLIPWLFLFISGGYIGIYFKENKLPEFFYKSHSKLLEWLGRHSLMIYLIHQPLLMAIFWVIF